MIFLVSDVCVWAYKFIKKNKKEVEEMSGEGELGTLRWFGLWIGEWRVWGGLPYYSEIENGRLSVRGWINRRWRVSLFSGGKYVTTVNNWMLN